MRLNLMLTLPLFLGLLSCSEENTVPIPMQDLDEELKSLSETQSVWCISHDNMVSALVFIMFDSPQLGTGGSNSGPQSCSRHWDSGDIRSLEIDVDSSSLELWETKVGENIGQMYRNGQLDITVHGPWKHGSSLKRIGTNYEMRPSGIGALLSDGTFTILPYEFSGSP